MFIPIKTLIREHTQKNPQLAAADVLLHLKGYWKDRSWEDSSGNKHVIKEFTARQIWRVDDGGKFTDILEEYNSNGATV